jgi:hypothetical protein
MGESARSNTHEHLISAPSKSNPPEGHSRYSAVEVSQQKTFKNEIAVVDMGNLIDDNCSRLTRWHSPVETVFDPKAAVPVPEIMAVSISEILARIVLRKRARMDRRREYDIGDGQSLVGAGEKRPPDSKPSVEDHGISNMEVPMIPQLKRFEIQVILNAGHSQAETGRIAKVSLRTVARVSGEPGVEHSDDGKERTRRGIGRPRLAM